MKRAPPPGARFILGDQITLAAHKSPCFAFSLLLRMELYASKKGQEEFRPAKSSAALLPPGGRTFSTTTGDLGHVTATV